MSAGHRLFTIAPHVAFVDALALGLVARAGGDALALANTQVLLPNRRAVRTLTDAFVRHSGGGLLLPRLTPVGDIGDDSFDRFASGDSVLPPAVPLLQRRLELARLVRQLPAGRDAGRSAVEALRLGDALGATLDALLAAEIAPDHLKTVLADTDLASHWQATLAFLDLVITHWPAARDAAGGSDGGTRTGALIDAMLARWRSVPPPGLVVAAGITGSSPPIVRLLAGVLALPQGLVVLPGLDTDMSDAGCARWAAIACRAADLDLLGRDAEEHPQYALKALLARLRRDRDDVADWGVTTDFDGPAGRTPRVQAAMAPADAADGWHSGITDAGGAFAGVTTVEAATPAEEAQVIALALRRALETPGQRAALVTPDRQLARRVAAHCRRWGLDIDDSAGTPLRLTPPGTLALALVEAMAQGFAPVALLAVLKHPLVAAGDDRGAWLAQVRRLDRTLRGVRPPPGLEMVGEAVDAFVADRRRRLRRENAEATAIAAAEAADVALIAWWRTAAVALEPLAGVADARPGLTLPDLAAALRDAGGALAGEKLWSGIAGRALADLVDRLELHGASFGAFDTSEAPALVAALLDGAVRPAWGGHPRIAILGPLEAQLQRTDLMILGGLNEGTWPGRPAPDPWLAPAIRTRLGLAGLARDIGLAAHDFVSGLGAPQVLLTRSRRDASAPLVPSRFWLRLQAFTGGLAPDSELLALARRLDGQGQPEPVPPPRPAPPAARRPQTLYVTDVDTLIADPFAFYARAMLGLRPLDPLDQDPTAATRGTRIHEVMEDWIGSGGGSLDRLDQLTEAMLLAEGRQFPLLRALWAPRARRALRWAGEQVHAREADGWHPLAAEAGGALTLANGIIVQGRADRVDRDGEGRLAIIDYKTGKAPSPRRVREHAANQLTLLMAMAMTGQLRTRAGGVPRGLPHAIAYWEMGGGKPPGEIVDALKGKPPIDLADHIDAALAVIVGVTDAYLLGTAPFRADLNPNLAWGDYNHLSRVAEWLDRPRGRST
ncbi:double-strand break repair protein AddB [Polymorphobacter fuscus]|uniref:double-strand break repair protein AddB n=1 Tax=Sandarakinorhabdus fusca TaxID=1439888 RepID=UPI00169D00C7|nr:double-strand break repair protein AddB [Polymorphobacter fuscus]NJC09347.1 ATP-dependent helicase/nuclease subunit B [Polymorphobacter fuscus]